MRLEIIYISVLLLKLVDGYAQLSETMHCADHECSETLSEGKAKLAYQPKDKKFLHLKKGDFVLVKGKRAGLKVALWGGQVIGNTVWGKNTFGFFPSAFVKETTILQEKPSVFVNIKDFLDQSRQDEELNNLSSNDQKAEKKHGNKIKQFESLKELEHKTTSTPLDLSTHVVEEHSFSDIDSEYVFQHADKEEEAIIEDSRAGKINASDSEFEPPPHSESSIPNCQEQNLSNQNEEGIEVRQDKFFTEENNLPVSSTDSELPPNQDNQHGGVNKDVEVRMNAQFNPNANEPESYPTLTVDSLKSSDEISKLDMASKSNTSINYDFMTPQANVSEYANTDVCYHNESSVSFSRNVHSNGFELKRFFSVSAKKTNRFDKVQVEEGIWLYENNDGTTNTSNNVYKRGQSYNRATTSDMSNSPEFDFGINCDTKNVSSREHKSNKKPVSHSQSQPILTHSKSITSKFKHRHDINEKKSSQPKDIINALKNEAELDLCDKENVLKLKSTGKLVSNEHNKFNTEPVLENEIEHQSNILTPGSDELPQSCSTYTSTTEKLFHERQFHKTIKKSIYSCNSSNVFPSTMLSSLPMPYNTSEFSTCPNNSKHFNKKLDFSLNFNNFSKTWLNNTFESDLPDKCNCDSDYSSKSNFQRNTSSKSDALLQFDYKSELQVRSKSRILSKRAVKFMSDAKNVTYDNSKTESNTQSDITSESNAEINRIFNWKDNNEQKSNLKAESNHQFQSKKEKRNSDPTKKFEVECQFNDATKANTKSEPHFSPDDYNKNNSVCRDEPNINTDVDTDFSIYSHQVKYLPVTNFLPLPLYYNASEVTTFPMTVCTSEKKPWHSLKSNNLNDSWSNSTIELDLPTSFNSKHEQYPRLYVESKFESNLSSICEYQQFNAKVASDDLNLPNVTKPYLTSRFMIGKTQEKDVELKKSCQHNSGGHAQSDDSFKDNLEYGNRNDSITTIDFDSKIKPDFNLKLGKMYNSSVYSKKSVKFIRNTQNIKSSIPTLPEFDFETNSSITDKSACKNTSDTTPELNSQSQLTQLDFDLFRNQSLCPQKERTKNKSFHCENEIELELRDKQPLVAKFNSNSMVETDVKHELHKDLLKRNVTDKKSFTSASELDLQFHSDKLPQSCHANSSGTELPTSPLKSYGTKRKFSFRFSSDTLSKVFAATSSLPMSYNISAVNTCPNIVNDSKKKFSFLSDVRNSSKAWLNDTVDIDLGLQFDCDSANTSETNIQSDGSAEIDTLFLFDSKSDLEVCSKSKIKWDTTSNFMSDIKNISDPILKTEVKVKDNTSLECNIKTNRTFDNNQSSERIHDRKPESNSQFHSKKSDLESNLSFQVTNQFLLSIQSEAPMEHVLINELNFATKRGELSKLKNSTNSISLLDNHEKQILTYNISSKYPSREIVQEVLSDNTTSCPVHSAEEHDLHLSSGIIYTRNRSIDNNRKHFRLELEAQIHENHSISLIDGDNILRKKFFFPDTKQDNELVISDKCYLMLDQEKNFTKYAFINNQNIGDVRHMFSQNVVQKLEVKYGNHSDSAGQEQSNNIFDFKSNNGIDFTNIAKKTFNRKHQNVQLDQDHECSNQSRFKEMAKQNEALSDMHPPWFNHKEPTVDECHYKEDSGKNSFVTKLRVSDSALDESSKKFANQSLSPGNTLNAVQLIFHIGEGTYTSVEKYEVSLDTKQDNGSNFDGQCGSLFHQSEYHEIDKHLAPDNITLSKISSRLNARLERKLQPQKYLLIPSQSESLLPSDKVHAKAELSALPNIILSKPDKADAMLNDKTKENKSTKVKYDYRKLSTSTSVVDVENVLDKQNWDPSSEEGRETVESAHYATNDIALTNIHNNVSNVNSSCGKNNYSNQIMQTKTPIVPLTVDEVKDFQNEDNSNIDLQTPPSAYQVDNNTILESSDKNNFSEIYTPSQHISHISPPVKDNTIVNENINVVENDNERNTRKMKTLEKEYNSQMQEDLSMANSAYNDALDLKHKLALVLNELKTLKEETDEASTKLINREAKEVKQRLSDLEEFLIDWKIKESAIVADAWKEKDVQNHIRKLEADLERRHNNDLYQAKNVVLTLKKQIDKLQEIQRSCNKQPDFDYKVLVKTLQTEVEDRKRMDNYAMLATERESQIMQMKIKELEKQLQDLESENKRFQSFKIEAGGLKARLNELENEATDQKRKEEKMNVQRRIKETQLQEKISFLEDELQALRKEEDAIQTAHKETTALKETFIQLDVQMKDVISKRDTAMHDRFATLEVELQERKNTEKELLTKTQEELQEKLVTFENTLQMKTVQNSDKNAAEVQDLKDQIKRLEADLKQSFISNDDLAASTTKRERDVFHKIASLEDELRILTSRESKKICDPQETQAIVNRVNALEAQLKEEEEPATTKISKEDILLVLKEAVMQQEEESKETLQVIWNTSKFQQKCNVNVNTKPDRGQQTEFFKEKDNNPGSPERASQLSYSKGIMEKLSSDRNMKHAFNGEPTTTPDQDASHHLPHQVAVSWDESFEKEEEQKFSWDEELGRENGNHMTTASNVTQEKVQGNKTGIALDSEAEKVETRELKLENLTTRSPLVNEDLIAQLAEDISEPSTINLHLNQPSEIKERSVYLADDVSTNSSKHEDDYTEMAEQDRLTHGSDLPEELSNESTFVGDMSWVLYIFFVFSRLLPYIFTQMMV